VHGVLIPHNSLADVGGGIRVVLGLTSLAAEDTDVGDDMMQLSDRVIDESSEQTRIWGGKEDMVSDQSDDRE
jgi:hypothetical protein